MSSCIDFQSRWIPTCRNYCITLPYYDPRLKKHDYSGGAFSIDHDLCDDAGLF